MISNCILALKLSACEFLKVQEAFYSESGPVKALCSSLLLGGFSVWVPMKKRILLHGPEPKQAKVVEALYDFIPLYHHQNGTPIVIITSSFIQVRTKQGARSGRTP